MAKDFLSEHFQVDNYNNDFVDFDDVVGSYRARVTEDDIVILWADYTYEDYQGESEVYFFDKRDGLFYEVHAYHCSCYGLEDQWEPEEIGDLYFTLEYFNRQDLTKVLK